MAVRDDPQAALMKAAESGSVGQIVAAVRAGADMNRRNAAGQTALTVATGPKVGALESATRVQCLLALGARVAAEDPRCGFGTSIHNSVICGYRRSLELLLQADGRSALSSFNSLGDTPLACAVISDSRDFARMLLEAGSPVNARDETLLGDTALAQAVRKGDAGMVELLVNHGADPRIVGWMKLTPLDMVDDLEMKSPGLAASIRTMLQSALGERHAKGSPDSGC